MSVTPSSPTSAAQAAPAGPAAPVDRLLRRPVWQVGALAVVAGAVLTEAFALAARGLGVSMLAATGDQEPAEIPVGGFATAVLVCATVGVLLALVLARFTRRPARIFAATTGVLTALSLVPPFLTTDTATSTQLVLAVAHLVAAAVVVPPLTRRLALVRR
ncbi:MULTISPECIES: DUF6069 family protein [Streptomyces]|uniref:DUF6069 family protein n=1 Tax=Streptomyces TaxID=1883 RepID=UPI00186B0CC6|nr:MULTISPECIES: DUF6069 family protein [Streptomyces]